MPFCIYCGQDKEAEVFSKEHIIPRALGGNLDSYNPFITYDVCGRCNNISGIFIDEPFIKSWFTQHNRAGNAFKYLDVDKDIVLPLSFMGIVKDLGYEDKICDFWLGPIGEPIFHFHEPYPELLDVPPIVGIPTHARRKQIDYGFAFLYLKSDNPVWQKIAHYSFYNHFKKSTLYLGNAPTVQGSIYSNIPSHLISLHEELDRKLGLDMDKEDIEPLKLITTVNLYYGDRFLAKLALGFGAILLKESFKKSESADLLRKFMWTKTVQDREKLPVKIHNFTSSIVNEQLKKFLSWDGGHLIHIMPYNNKLLLYVNFYGGQEATVLISSEPEHWQNTEVNISTGIIYVISPTLQKCVGPLQLRDYIAHRVAPIFRVEDLAVLEEEMSRNKEVPSF